VMSAIRRRDTHRPMRQSGEGSASLTALRTESPVAPCAKHTRDHEQCVAAAKQALLGCGWCESGEKSGESGSAGRRKCWRSYVRRSNRAPEYNKLSR